MVDERSGPLAGQLRNVWGSTVVGGQGRVVFSLCATEADGTARERTEWFVWLTSTQAPRLYYPQYRFQPAHDRRLGSRHSTSHLTSSSSAVMSQQHVMAISITSRAQFLKTAHIQGLSRALYIVLYRVYIFSFTTVRVLEIYIATRYWYIASAQIPAQARTMGTALLLLLL